MRFSFSKTLFILLFAACLTPWASAPAALVAGVIFSFILGHPFPALSAKLPSRLLQISVVGLGFGMQFQSAIAAGKDGIWLTLATFAAVFATAFLFGKFLKMPVRQTHLIASGTAICGGSAIAAVAPAVNASKEEISVSLGIVFLLNSLALLVFPPVGHLFEMTQHQFGLWCAIAIHDTSSVVGAANTFGAEALQTATTVKLARALWIIPLSFASALLFKSKNQKMYVPWFIVFFVLAMLAGSFVPAVAQNLGKPAASASKSLLVATLFLIGASLSPERIKAVGWKPFVLGVVPWIAVSALSLTAIVLLFE